MADRVEWVDHDQQVILQTFEGKTSWESFYNIAKQTADLLNAVDHPVQLIVDRSNAIFFRINTQQMVEIEKILSPNQDLVIVVGAGIYVEVMSKELGAMVAPGAFDETFYVETMAEAYEVLRRERNIDIE